MIKPLEPSPAPPAGTNRFVVPPAQEWPALHDTVTAFLSEGHLTPPLSFDELSEQAGLLIAQRRLPEAYREFILVLLNNALWMDVVAAIPFKRRTLLLPPCLRSSTACRAQFDEYGLLCEECGQCCIADLSREAGNLGYAVLVAEGTGIVEKLLQQGSVDAVIGVSCMASLEKSFHRLADRAVPGLAIPLLQEGCRDTRVIEDWVRRTMRLHTSGWVPVEFPALHAMIGEWFSESSLRALLDADGSDTARIGIQWLAQSGKRWRPFLTTALHQTLVRDASGTASPALRKLAVAVECLHKASLIFDDIQDNDTTRYGETTPHERHGVPVAMTAGLYLLGQGYRLIAACGAPAEQVVEMVRITSEGHRDLCLGQGSELWWSRYPRRLSAAEVLEIFRYKTAPAFEVGLRLGAILGGATAAEHAVLTDFSQNLGIAYQIADDLEDYQDHGERDDIQAGRLSILAALAAELADPSDRSRLEASGPGGPHDHTELIRRLIAETGAVPQARQMLLHYRGAALTALRLLQNRELKWLLHRIAGAMCAE
jgi:geranylgeranyl diphosphate synthase type II